MVLACPYRVDVVREEVTAATAPRLLLGLVRSRYRWNGKVELAEEVQLLFKTSALRALELERYIAAHHPYETPEIVSWPASASAAYGQWVVAETHRPTHV